MMERVGGKVKDFNVYELSGTTSLDDWISFIQKQFKLKINYLQDNEKYELVEIYQRRNLLVHNRGIINTLYITKIPSEFRKGISIGDRVDVSRDYIEKAVLRFERFFVLIASDLWKQIEPSNRLSASPKSI